MLSYIASKSTSEIIQKICKRKNILILNSNENVNIKNYIKETKINFSLIRYFIIEIDSLESTQSEIIDSIYNFSLIYRNVRIIILAQGYNEKNTILSQLYEKGIYNIINEDQVEQKLYKALSEKGLQKKDSKQFKKVEEVVKKQKKYSKVIEKLKINIAKLIRYSKNNNNNKLNKDEKEAIHHIRGVYFFAVFMDVITKFIKLICNIVIFLLTSLGITILLNSQLRDMIFQIVGLK